MIITKTKLETCRQNEERERENESDHNENRAQNYNNKRWQRQQTNKQQAAAAGGLRIQSQRERDWEWITHTPRGSVWKRAGRVYLWANETNCDQERVMWKGERERAGERCRMISTTNGVGFELSSAQVTVQLWLHVIHTQIYICTYVHTYQNCVCVCVVVALILLEVSSSHWFD